MYEEHFKLNKQPFSTITTGADVFVGPQTAKTMSGFRKALTAQDAVVTVSGRAGTGKTTLVHRAIDAIGTKYKTIRVGRMKMDSNDVLEALLVVLGVEDRPAGIIQRFAALRKKLKKLEDREVRVFIVVEDALRAGTDTLAELEALTAADAGESGGASIVLMGDERLADFMKDPQLAQMQQRVRQRHTILPLCVTEFRGFLKHSFRLAGGDFEDIFDTRSAELLHQLSDGIPRVAINLVESILTAAADQGLEKIPVTFIASVASEEYGLCIEDFDFSDKESTKPDNEEPAEPEAESAVAEAESEAAADGLPEPEPLADIESETETEADVEPEHLVDAAADSAANHEEDEKPGIDFADDSDDSHEGERDIPKLIQDTLPNLAILAPQYAVPDDQDADKTPEVVAESERESAPFVSEIPELGAEPEPVKESEPEADAFSEFVAESEQESEPDVNEIPELVAEPEPVKESEPEADAYSEFVAESEQESKPGVSEIPELVAEPEPEAELGADAIPELVADPEPEVDVNPERVAEPEADVTPELVAEAELVADAIPELVTETEPVADAIPELVAGTEPDADVDSELVVKPWPVAEAIPELVAESELVADDMLELITEPEPATEFVPELADDPEPVTEFVPELVAEPEPLAEFVPELATDPEPATEFVPELVAEPEPLAEFVPELTTDPEPATEFVPELVAEEPATETTLDRECDPDPVGIEPDLDALEHAMAFAHSGIGESTGQDQTTAESLSDSIGEKEEMPEIILDEVIETDIEKMQSEKPDDSVQPQSSGKPSVELGKIAAEIASAKTLDDVDDRMAETLFGTEISMRTAQLLTSSLPETPANDELQHEKQMSADNAPVNMSLREEISLESTSARKMTGLDLNASQRLKTVRALNAESRPSLGKQKASTAKGTSGNPGAVAPPKPIEDQINTSITQTLKALEMPADLVDDEPEEEKKRGFFSRFRRS